MSKALIQRNSMKGAPLGKALVLSANVSLGRKDSKDKRSILSCISVCVAKIKSFIALTQCVIINKTDR